MGKSQCSEVIERSATRAGSDFNYAAIYYGMTLEEFEGLVGAFRREVEDGIRAARVRLLERIERKGGGDNGKAR